MIRARFSSLAEPCSDAAKRVVVGSGEGAPEARVLVEREGLVFCIDIHPEGPQACPFSDVVIWADLIVIGYGSALYAVDANDFGCQVHDFSGYFGSIFVGEDFCLIASDESILRLAKDGTALWHQRGLAADGIIVEDVLNGLVRASGQWDPPDADWRAFQLDLATGRVVVA